MPITLNQLASFLAVARAVVSLGGQSARLVELPLNP
jgi:hypothetical protein